MKHFLFFLFLLFSFLGNSQCLTPQALTGATTLNCSDSVTLTMGNSDLNAIYYLVDSATQTIVNGPTTGTGGVLTFSTGLVTSTTPYQINGVSDTNFVIDFDGTDENAFIPSNNILRPGNAITIEAWIYARDLTTNPFQEIYRKEDGNERHLLSFQDTGKVISFGIATNNVYAELDVPINLVDYENQWVHIAATYDGTTKRIYRNGTEIGNSVATGTMATTGTANSYIGSQLGLSEFFDGKIDELKIWSIARDPIQINNGMDPCFALNQSGLLLYLTMNDTTGGAIKDISGNNLNATILQGTTPHTSPNTVWKEAKTELVSNSVTIDHQPIIDSIIYVNVAAVGANNGSCWTDAFNHLQDALGAAQTGDQIWVAQGAYRPDLGIAYSLNDRTLSFHLKDSIALYGGFIGNETLLIQRNWATHLTVLTGSIGGFGLTDNSYCVVQSTNLDSTAIIDGFTIRDGWNNSNSFSINAGGIRNYNSSPIISNCTITFNDVYNPYSSAGGIMNIFFSSPTIINCIISNNYVNSSSADGAGGIMNFYYSSPTVINCSITNNEITGSSSTGGIMNYDNCNPTIINCIISNNKATSNYSNSFSAGGVMNYDNCNLKIINSTISNNESTSNGSFIYRAGGIMNDDSSPTIINCNITNNESRNSSSNGYSGGGITNRASSPIITNSTITNNLSYNSSGSSAGGIMGHSAITTINNSIIWNNISSATNNSLDILNQGSAVTVNSSLLETYTGGNNCIVGQNPLFVNQGSTGINGGGDFHLQANSPARNMGSTNLLPNDVTDLDSNNSIIEHLPLDFDYLPRVNACEVDMGAYEYIETWATNVMDSTKCTDGTMVSFVSSGVSLQWYTDIALTNLIATGDTLLSGQSNAGVYNYYLSDSTFNCPRQISDTITLTINALPTPILGADTAFCAGDSIQLNGGTFSNYLWSTTDTTQSVHANTIGNYTILVTDANGCQNTDAIFVSQNALPTPNLGVDTLICNNGNIALTPGTFNSYLWNDATTSATLLIDGNITGAGNFTYFVNVTDNNGCMNTDSIAVNVTICTDVDDRENTYNISTYPNPTKGNLTINLGNYSGTGSIKISNPLGQVIYEKNTIESIVNLNLTQPKGIYFVEINSMDIRRVFTIIKE